jgi:hypothetical protein
MRSKISRRTARFAVTDQPASTIVCSWRKRQARSKRSAVVGCGRC